MPEFGSLADILTSPRHVFFPLKADILSASGTSAPLQVRLVEYYSHVLLLQNATVAS